MCQKHLILSIKQGYFKILPPVYLAPLRAKFAANCTVGAAHARHHALCGGSTEQLNVGQICQHLIVSVVAAQCVDHDG